MKTLVVIPTQEEFNFFLESCTEYEFRVEDSTVGRLPVVQFPDLGIILSRGGLGKVQFAVQTQHLLDAHPDWDLVICAGAAGALVDSLSVGDVVVATETVEHDINNRFGPPLLPRFRGAETIVADLRSVSPVSDSFQVHFGPIASGDEDVIDAERKQTLHQVTGGLAVAWEGAGGARACQFNDIPFIEIRGISDSADGDAASDYETNLAGVMRNVAALITYWVRGQRT
jgi:adenosylhomocysteine nucleosidase